MIHQLIDLWLKGWRSLLEVLLLWVAIYYGYLYFRGTRGAKVLTGLAIVFLTLTLISTLLNLVVIGWIVRSFSVFLAIALVVIFQPELRRGLAALGGHPIFSLTSERRETVHDLAEAVTQLANKQFGALIAIERDTSIRVYEETGVIIDGEFSVELILTIFHPKAALHDGGVIIRNGRIAAAACIFPVSQRETLDRSLGITSPRRAWNYRGIGCGRCRCLRRDRRNFHLSSAPNRAQFYSRNLPSADCRNFVA